MESIKMNIDAMSYAKANSQCILSLLLLLLSMDHMESPFIIGIMILSNNVGCCER